MFNNIRCDLYRYHTDLIKGMLFALCSIGFWAVLNYRVGVCLRYKFRSVPLVNKLVWMLTGLSRLFINIITGIDIPYSAKIGPGLKICHFSCIFISSHTVIGKNCTIHQGVTIGKGGHLTETDEPVIMDDVFIGANVTIIGAIYIGNGVRIGSNVCCYKSVDDDMTVVSGGMRIIKNENSCTP